jgi:AcrR family transcriptional regulator
LSGGKELNSRRIQAIETRNRLFECAHKLLREHDFKNITIRDICKDAGVSIGTFYLYFPSKLDVYYQTYEIADRYFEERVAPKLTQSAVKERIAAFFDNYATYNAAEAGLRLTRLLYNSDNKYFNRNNNYGIVKVLNDLISEGIANGELKRAHDAEKIAKRMMIAARGLVYHWCLSDGKYDLNAEMNEYINMILNAIQ